MRRQTERSVTMTLRPNRAFGGFRAGQFVRVGVEIDGVRRTRTYSPACSQHGADRRLELTVTAHPEGLVSPWLIGCARPGAIVHLGEAQGEFVLPDARPERLVLIGGGSGITPVMSMLRTLCDEQHAGEITFIHYARTEADWLYRAEVEALAARHPNVSARLRRDAASGGGSGVCARPELEGALVAVCGPPALIEAVQAEGAPRASACGDVHPAESDRHRRRPRTERSASCARSAPRAIAAGTLLEQAEAAGLSPEFGCRMGICRTCTCRKSAGAVRNLLTGEVSDEEDVDIQLCVRPRSGTSRSKSESDI